MGKKEKKLWAGEPEDSVFDDRKKKKGLSKLDRKKEEQLRKAGLVPEEPKAALKDEATEEPTEDSDPIVENKLEGELRDVMLEPGSLTDRVENIKGEENKTTTPESFPKDRIKLVAYKDFADKINSLQTREELLEYLSNSGEFKLRNEEGNSNAEHYFPAFSNKVRDVFTKELLLATLKDIPALYQKVWEIIKKEKNKKEREREDAVKSTDAAQEKRNPTQKEADILEASLKSNGNKKTYANGSIPEDAAEMAERIKKSKIAEKNIKNKKKNSKSETALEDEKTKERKKQEEAENKRKQEEERRESINNAKTFFELFDAIDDMGEIADGTIVIKAAQIKDKINTVRESVKDYTVEEFEQEMRDQTFLIDIVETYGIKDKVASLILEKKKEEAAEDKKGAKGTEQSEKEKELMAKLEEARKAFIEKDEEAEKKKLSFKNVLWKTLKIGSLGEYEKEHEDAKNKYYAALKNYKDEMLAFGRIRTEEDVKKFVDFLNVSEDLSRKSARIDVKAKDSKWWSKAGRGYMRIVEWYKNIGKDDKSKLVRFLKKASVGLAIGGGVAFAGGAFAGAAGSFGAAALWRLFSVSVSATGFKGMFEGIAENKRKKDSSKEVESIVKNSKLEGSGEMQADLVSQNLDKMIEEIDRKMQKDKKYARWRSGAAILTAGTISYLGQLFGREMAGNIKNYFHNMPMTMDQHVPASIGGNSHIGAGSSYEDYQMDGKTKIPGWYEQMHPEAKPIPGAEDVFKAEQFVDLKPIGSGGSIEGSIIEHLKQNPDLIEKYNQLNGGRKFDAGQIAHRMFTEYGVENKPFDLVHEGAQVNLSADGLHIESVTGDDHMGFLHEKVAEGVGAGKHYSGILTPEEMRDIDDQIARQGHEPGATTVDHAGSQEATQNPGVGAETMSRPSGAQGTMQNPEVAVPNFDKVHGSFFGHNTDEFMNSTDRELFNAERGYGGNYGPAMSPTPGPGVDSAWFENTKFSQSFLEDFRNKIFEGDKSGATKVFREKISEAAFGGKNHWDSLKDLTFGEAKEQLKNDKLGSLFRNMQKILGDSIKPLRDETMAKWTLRVSKMAVEQTNIKY